VVIHDECSAGVTELPVIDAVLAPHKDGIPGVNLHCAMHCYRFGDFQKPVPVGADNSHWYEYLGLQSTGHGPQEPIAIHFSESGSPITKGSRMDDGEGRALQQHPDSHRQGTRPRQADAACEDQGPDGKDVVTGSKEAETVVAWTNEYGPKKTRVFSTTIGHNNDTVADDRYLIS